VEEGEDEFHFWFWIWIWIALVGLGLGESGVARDGLGRARGVAFAGGCEGGSFFSFFLFSGRC